MSPRHNAPNPLDSPDSARGRFRAVFGRIIGDAEHPLTWSIPAGSIAGIRVRIHLLFIVYAIAQVLWSIRIGYFGPGYTALAMVILFALVLMHELGHCLACRWVGGEADEVMMWPLGGLAVCHPPEEWRANLITSAGGPAVNLVLAPITSAALLAAGRPGAIVFNPLEVGPLLLTQIDSWWLTALWLLHALNLVLLVFNILLPIFPLDGGRILHALLWRRHGRRRATEIAATAGLVGSGALAILALVAESALLLSIAIFCGLVSWSERQRLRAPDDISGGSSVIEPEPDPEESARRVRLEARRRRREREARAELDRVLAKIAREGMPSLNRAERRTLQKATRRTRSRTRGRSD